MSDKSFIKKQHKELRLHCFSPPVMIATFVIEMALAIYTVWRYKLNPVTRLAVALFVCLALFQLAEYNVCEGALLLDGLGWAKLGYISITMLPPLGIHLIATISGDKRRWIWMAGYGLAALFVGYFLFVINGVNTGVCLGNYVIFEHGENLTYPYAAYYYGLLLLAIFYAHFRAKKASGRIRAALKSLVIGYALFMTPTTLVNIIDPSTIYGIPSIMCGFAVLLAVVLAGKVMPDYFQK